MTSRVRFSTDQPDVAFVPAAVQRASLVGELLSHPLPPFLPDSLFDIDVCTAASIGDVHILQRCLIEKGKTNLNARNKSSWTPLHYASYLGHDTACSFLLENGALVRRCRTQSLVQIDGCNAKGQTALQLAAACGNHKTVKLLLEAGATVDTTDKDGRTALHNAAACSQNTVVEALLAAGADPNKKDTNGNTPTLDACATVHELTITALLEKGGDPTVRNKRDEDGALLAGDSPRIQALLSQTAFPKNLSELLEAMQLERLKEKFRKENIDLNLFFDLEEKMGIAFGPKKRILTVIERYKKTGRIDEELVPFEDRYKELVQGSKPSEAQLDELLVVAQKAAREAETVKRLALAALDALREKKEADLRTTIVQLVERSEDLVQELSRLPSSSK